MVSKISLRLLMFIGLLGLGPAAISHAATVYQDSAITASIKTEMLKDKLVSPLDIKVETNKGVVSLSGQVKSHAEAERVLEIAFSIAGVVDVNAANLNIVGSGQPLKDAMITAKVKGTLAREKVFGDQPVSVFGIHIETIDGTVFITGKVQNKTKLETIERLAKEVRGVKEVKSNLEVQ
jgi:hyperosmotically inducible protein